MKPSKFSGKILRSVSAQAVSLLVSFVLGFVVPRYIDAYQYAYWHIFLLYLGYVGVLHFGMLDGVVLRYSQYDYNALDKERIRSQYAILLCSTGAIAVLLCALSQLFLSGDAKTVAMLVACGVITKNLIWYDLYTFQITNRIRQYAALIITQRLGYGLFAVALLAAGVQRFEWYCIADLAGDCAGLILARFSNKGLHFGRCIPLRDAMQEWKANVAAGSLLLIANWSAILLIGSTKMIIQWRWGELVFGKVSFAFSIANLFLAFISALSVVLFPQLKRTEPEALPRLYRKMRNMLTPLLFAALLLYFPGCRILEIYLPAYSQSLEYLGFLLPIILFTSKVNLLTNNYLKTYRREREMLFVNLFSVLLSVCLVVFCAYVLHSMHAVLVSVVVTTAVYAFLSETAVSRVTGLSFSAEFVVEALMAAAFICCIYTMERWTACAAYTAALLAYLLYIRRKGMKRQET